MKSKIIVWIHLFLLLGGSPWNQLKAQSGIPLLERSITISLDRETLESALKKIGQQGGFTFSYNPAVVKADRVVTHNFVDKTVREILDELFNGAILYKERGNYIILNRSEESSSSKDKQQITGYVIDEATGSRLKNVSIYDPVSLASAVTDDYGYFQIDLPESAKDEVKLAVRKQHYTDTVVVASGIRRLMNIRIKTDRFNVFADSVGSKMKRFWRSTKNATILAINMENIDDTLYRSFQFSFIPFVGTNHKLSGHVINDYSLNMFGGYSLGVEKFELAGFFNTVRGDVHGVQVAGFVNGVMGNVEGVQLAGFVNATRGTVKGAQLAGFVNATRDTAEGFQMAGFINFNWKSSKTVGLAGLTNFNLKDSRGVKLAGISNTTIGKQEGPHIAGLFNFSAGGARSASVAGIMNFTAGNMNGAQVAGVLNFAGGNVNGAQVGVLNYGRRVKGAQVGILNIADSVKGVPIGVLSIVRKGYHTIELSADEIFYTNLAFRTGVRQFYNIITAGVKPASFSEDKTYWTFGYGIGTAPKLTRWLYLNFDLTANQVLKGKIDEINMLNKLYLGVEFKTKRKLALTLGATLNGYVTDTTYGEYPDLFTDYTPHIIHDRTYSNDINLKMWWGGKIGIRFL